MDESTATTTATKKIKKTKKADNTVFVEDLASNEKSSPSSIDTFIGRIINDDSEKCLQLIPDNCIDLTITSPPYDDIRDYNGYNFNDEILSNIIKQLYRVTANGGVVVWIVGDATTNGSESGSSFKQALKFMEAGFKLHDTMIYEKNTSSFPAKRNGNRYTQIFEYMFVFCKG